MPGAEVLLMMMSTPANSPVQSSKRYGASAEFGGERGGLVRRTVGDEDVFDAAGEQGARGLLAGVARADDHHRTALEARKNLSGQFHGYRLATEMLPRWMPVAVRMCLAMLKARWKALQVEPPPV